MLFFDPTYAIESKPNQSTRPDLSIDPLGHGPYLLTLEHITMKSISTLIASSLLLGASTVSAYGASAPGPVVYKGCYSTSTGLSLNSSYTFNTQGYCQTQCAPLSYNVLATSQSTDCYCGNEIPPAADLVSDSYCSSPCAGYGQDMCMWNGSLN